MSKHLIHKHSDELVGGGAKLPQAEQIEYGELAVNYAKGYESIALKNNQNEIVSLKLNSTDDNPYEINVVEALIPEEGNIGEHDDFGCIILSALTNEDIFGGWENLVNAVKSNRVIKDAYASENMHIDFEGAYTEASSVLQEHVILTPRPSAMVINDGNSLIIIIGPDTATTQYNCTFIITNPFQVLNDDFRQYFNDVHQANKIIYALQGLSGVTSAFSASVISEMSNIGGVGKVYPGSVSGEVFNDYFSCKAIGNFSHAEGSCTIAKGWYAHAEGNYSSAIGSSSHAEGFRTIASGSSSHAEGDYSSAIGINSHAEGTATLSDGWYTHAEGESSASFGRASHAEGYETIAQGGYSHAEGKTTSAIGDYSHAEGRSNISISDGSHSEGVHNIASGYSSHAEGSQTLAKGVYSHAEGWYSEAIGDFSHAEGSFTAASGGSSHAEGSGTTASGLSSHSEGYQTNAIGDYSHAEGFGERPFDTNLLSATDIQIYDKWFNVLNIYNRKTFSLAKGTGSHVEGCNNLVLAPYSHAEGDLSAALGYVSHAEGARTYAAGNYSHAEGSGTSSVGLVSHSEGKRTSAVGDYSHAEGRGTIASGDSSHAEGDYTSALSTYSHAEGSQTIAKGTSAHAEGRNSKAIGSWAHAEGQASTASGDASHAGGYICHAIGDYSFATGFYTCATTESSAAFGKCNCVVSGTALAEYNVAEASAQTLFSIGNGRSTFSRRNIFEIKANGDAYFIGIGNYNGTNSPGNSAYTSDVLPLQKLMQLVLQ